MVGWNAENPFVYNNRYYSNVTNQAFKDTGFSLIFRINAIVSATLGLFSILLVIYMVLFKTPVHFRMFSKMLFICSYADLYFLFADFWCQMRFRINEGFMIFAFDGPASYFSYFGGYCQSLSLQATAPLLAACTLPVQYFIRYKAIKSNSPLRDYQIFCWFLVAVFFSIIGGFTTARSFCGFENPDKIDFAQFWFVETPTPRLVISHQTFTPLIIHLTYFAITMLCAYTLAMLLARRTVVELKQLSNGMSTKTKSLQKQFAKTLLAQSLTPLFTAIFPVIFAILSMIFGVGSDYGGDFIALALTWFPFLNSMSNFLFIVPYRNFLIKLLKKLTCQESICSRRSTRIVSSVAFSSANNNLMSPKNVNSRINSTVF